jgi:hypothetical protein
LEVGAEGGFKLDLRQDHDPGKQKLKGAVRTKTYQRHYCQQSGSDILMASPAMELLFEDCSYGYWSPMTPDLHMDINLHFNLPQQKPKQQ